MIPCLVVMKTPGLVLVLGASTLACQRAQDSADATRGCEVSQQTIAAMEGRIEQEGAAAAEPLVQLVVASPVALPPGELNRLGRLLLSQSDPAPLLDKLRELAVDRPASDELQDWLHALERYEASIIRGIDVNVGNADR